jgi:hypothetical protein
MARALPMSVARMTAQQRAEIANFVSSPQVSRPGDGYSGGAPFHWCNLSGGDS